MTDTTLGLVGELVLAPGERGLMATVSFHEDCLIVETEDGERNEWQRDVVRGVPYDTSTVQLHLDSATLYFHAEDPLAFADRLAEYQAEPRPRKRRNGRTALASQRSTEAADKVDLRNLDAPVTAAPSRSRRRKAEHIHEWVSHTIGGGIVRRICTGCGDLSIDVTEAYEMLSDPSVVRNRRL